VTTVAVVGVGAAGVITAAHLARRWPAGHPLRVLMYDAGSRPGRGAAYSTADPQHLLNVPAANMSALADDADDFVHWLQQRDPQASADEFRPRSEYGDYLVETLADSAAAIALDVRRTTVTDVTRTEGCLRVVHDSGEDEVDACVLALGHAPPADPPEVVTPTATSYISDPWSPGALAAAVECTTRGDKVLLIGSGLTAVDVALSLTAQDRRVVAVSRHGWLPRRHRLPMAQPVPLADDYVTPPTSDALVRLVDRHVRRAAAGPGGWRAGVDGLRPVTGRLWSRLPPSERRAFLAGPARQWEVLRHRMAPAVADEIDQLIARKDLVVRKAVVLLASREERAWRVKVRTDGPIADLTVAAVVNCTGPSCDLTRYPSGLGRRLLRSGLVVPDELALGLKTASDGAVVDADGMSDGRLWALGALRRGSLYESTAIPELREQAATIAEQLVARMVSAPRPARRARATDASSPPLRASAGRG
jgi:uncharacterized NAD(P)/FAD-binding protein YdhS